MIAIDDTLISDDLIEKDFVCNLKACKGVCCIEGDSGAPVTEDEKKEIDDAYQIVKPYMLSTGIVEVEKQGKYVIDNDGDLVTPLVNNKDCAYLNFDEEGIGKCAFEHAYEKGEIAFKKPISCHLFPVRLKKYSSFTAVNYQSLKICSDACKLGAELKLPVYMFLKEALERRFGTEWFEALDAVAKEKRLR